MKIMLFALAASFAANAVAADQMPPSPVRPASRVAGATDKMICKTEGEIGTRLTRSRVCHTAAEWAEMRREEKANVDRIQMGRVWDSHNCPKPGSCD